MKIVATKIEIKSDSGTASFELEGCLISNHKL